MKGRLIAAALVVAALPVLAAAQEPPLGSARLTVDGAVAAFQSVCLDSLPVFERSPAVLAKLRFAQSPTTGTWFHPDNEVSFSLEPSDGRPLCSMVFASDEAAGALGLGLALATAASGGGSDVSVDPITGFATAWADGGAELVFSVGSDPKAVLYHAILWASE